MEISNEQENKTLTYFTNPKTVHKKSIPAVLTAQFLTALIICTAFIAVKLLFPDLFAALKSYIMSYIG